MKRVFLAMIHFHQRFISSFAPPTCRFRPTCLKYTREATQYHGIFKGLYLDTHHILRCHPLHKGDFGPVPLEKDKSADEHSRKHNH